MDAPLTTERDMSRCSSSVIRWNNGSDGQLVLLSLCLGIISSKQEPPPNLSMPHRSQIFPKMKLENMAEDRGMIQVGLCGRHPGVKDPFVEPPATESKLLDKDLHPRRALVVAIVVGSFLLLICGSYGIWCIARMCRS